MSRPTLSLADCAATTWDVIVIGAGPAGAMAAIRLARRGVATLLVDAKRFPRPKVCGGCLNRRGIEALRKEDLARVLVHCKATTVHAMHWIIGHQRTRLVLPDMCVVDRAAFDEALADEAVRAGAAFLDGVQAVVQPDTPRNCRLLTATRHDEHTTLAARAVVCADGLARSSLKRLPEFRTQAAPQSRIGVGATLADAASWQTDEITMIVGRDGYIGLARNGGGVLNIAAALDPHAVAATGISSVVERLTRDAECPLGIDAQRLDWHGTPPLTSRPGRVAGERLFVIGDASGYVEPFSGEGMATAFETGAAVAPGAAEAAHRWQPAQAAEWRVIHRSLVDEQQSTCRQLAWILRRPRVASAAVGVCRLQPWIANRFIARVS